MYDSKIIITILTWDRWEIFGETLSSLTKYNPDCNYPILVLDNGSSDKPTKDVKKQIKDRCDLIKLKKNRGASRGTMKLWKMALKKYQPQYILHVEDDFPCVKSVPFGAILSFMDKYEDVGFCQLNDKSEMLIKKGGKCYIERTERKYNIITGDNLSFVSEGTYDGMEIFKGNHHFTFNPTLFRTDIIVPITKGVNIEKDVMVNFQKLKLKSSKLSEPCFQTVKRKRQKGWHK
ncbi:MAG: glycosyltransferase family 2 protein [Atribacterota bacterium]